MSLFDKVKQHKLLGITLVFFTLVFGIGIGTLINRGVRASRPAAEGAADATPLTIPAAARVPNEFSKLAKKLEPSVVYIHSDYLPKVSSAKKQRPGDEDEEQGQPKEPGDMLRRFFGQDNADPRQFRKEGSGTGFIVDKNGYIITNYHVIDKADRVKVRLHDDSSDYRAKVIGFDPESDIAVIRIDAKKPLTPVQVGNSDGVDVGDWSVAIGSPFGLEATVTAGIVSATGRDLPGNNLQFQHFLQTDAAINPGNSGGPLLNIRGEVIGVNTMIATRSGAYEGIGFAMPSNMAVKVYNDIIRSGRVVRGSIGIQWRREERGDTLQAFGLDHGVIIDGVQKDGPAGRAGVHEDDIVVALNDRPVKNGEELVGKIADLPIGSMALLTVDRSAKRMDFKVKIEERAQVWKDSPVFASSAKPQTPEATPNSTSKLGMGIKAIPARDRQDLQLDANQGVRVVSVETGSFADDIGVREGDVILSINRHPISSPDEVMKMQSAFRPGQAVALRVQRTSTVAGRTAQAPRFYLSGRLSAD